MLHSIILSALTAVTIATMGEGRTSLTPETGIEAAQRLFTIYTLQEACAVTPVPATLLTRPVTLAVGEQFALGDAHVLAYDEAGSLIPGVPIEILDADTGTTILQRQVQRQRAEQDYVAVTAGEKQIIFRTLCGDGPALTATLIVSVRAPAEVQLAIPMPGTLPPADVVSTARVIWPVLSERLCSRSVAVMRNKIAYWLTLSSWEDDALICGVYTWDKAHVSAEGIRVGMPRAALAAFGPALPTEFDIYEAFALPSGWVAAVVAPHADEPDSPQAVVEFLFRELRQED